MDLLESTYGPMPQDFQMITTTMVNIPALVPSTQVRLLLHLLGITTIESRGIPEYTRTPCTSTTLCGMERVVVMVTTAVHNLECPGSVVLYHRKWRGTLKYVYVLTVGVKNSIWSFLRFTFNNFRN